MTYTNNNRLITEFLKVPFYDTYQFDTLLTSKLNNPRVYLDSSCVEVTVDMNDRQLLILRLLLLLCMKCCSPSGTFTVVMRQKSCDSRKKQQKPEVPQKCVYQGFQAQGNCYLERKPTRLRYPWYPHFKAFYYNVDYD